MAEDRYHEYKEDQRNVSVHVRQRTFRASAPGARVAMRSAVRRPQTVPADYPAFKATVVAAVEDIKLEIREQHQQTRAEVQTARRDILTAIKASPGELVKLVCEFGSLFLLFSLAVRFALKIELVNPAFALFMLFCFALYWGMAGLKQKSEKRAKHPQA